jgi:hypothetical protein
MILCYCCERRLGHSLAACDCESSYCHRCVLCSSHCECDPRQVAVVAVPSSTLTQAGRSSPQTTSDPPQGR